MKKLAPLVAVAVLAAGCGSSKKDCGDCSRLDNFCGRGVCNQTTWECELQPLNEAQACDDQNLCTENDVCHQGKCEGTPLDCSQYDSECTVGVCDHGDCVQQNRPDGTECLSGADACHAGRCREGKCQSEALENNTPCNDGDWCTENDACQEGKCTGTARDCSDEFDCTEDGCDNSLNACTHTVTSGWCLIDNQCLAHGTPSLQNPCLACFSDLDQTNWSFNDGAACDDQNRCTDKDTCQGGNCLGQSIAGCCLTDSDCADGVSCTADVCDQGTGTCSNPPLSGFCLIAGSCVAEGTLNPQNSCQSCQRDKDPYNWSNNSLPCDDGLFCTTNDLCQDGQCRGTEGLICDDNLECTQDVCDEGAQACQHTPSAGWCLIGGACYRANDVNQQNVCLYCDPATNPFDWSPRTGSVACDDNNRCTEQDSCQDGLCLGKPIPNCCTNDSECNDGLDCTQDSCEAASGTCIYQTQAGWCLINGVCYADGAPNSANLCQACVASRSQTNWSPANHHADCPGVCNWCENGACVPIADTNQDPFGECPQCRVCNGAGSCRPASDGTDPKDECVLSECTLENCLNGSCNTPVGTACTDQNEADCQDALCDGQGLCDQSFAPEASGHACDDADVCTASDLCNAFGSCAGLPVAPEPSPASSVAVTASCLTYGTGATSVVRVDLRSTSGQPISGATVNIEADEASLTWAGPVVESSTVPGVYYRLLRAPAVAVPGGDAVITVTARTGGGACQSSLVTLNTQPAITFAQPATGSTGGCSMEHNLRVKVIAAENGAPLAGAYVMVGNAEAAVFESDYEKVLAGQATILNTGRTDAQGMVEFTDHGNALVGPKMVTAGFENRSYVSYVGVDAADLVIALEPITARPQMAKIDGTVTNLGASDFDSWVNAAIVSIPFGIESLLRFNFYDLLAQQKDCWLATTLLGNEQWVEMPVNIFLPTQRERYAVIITVTINQHDYITLPLRVGATNQRIVALGGRAPWDDLVNLMMNGGSLADLVPLLELQRIGFIQRNTISGDEHDVAINANTSLSSNVQCRVENKPASLSGSSDLCLTVGDWSGGVGSGDLFIMGFKQLSGGQGTVTSVPASGAFAGIGYVGLGVAAYLTAPSGGDAWKARAASLQLDRSGNLSGNNLRFSSLLGITQLSASRPNFSWNSVSTQYTAAHFSEQRLELVDTQTYNIGDQCDPVTEEIWKNVLWKVYAPGSVSAFSLPALPVSWPRASAGGLAAPTADQYLRWSFAAYHLAPLAPSFDFNHFDFAGAFSQVTHSSTNWMVFQ